MTNELRRVLQVTKAHFKVLSYHSPGQNEENYKN